MKNIFSSINRVFAASALFGLLMFPAAALALPATVQTQGNRSNASANEFGASIASSALISVVVTDANGLPVSNLGASVGNGTSAITLPVGWSLQSGFNVVPGGCLLSTTQFSNNGNGIYSIRVVPFVNNAACKWLSGDYHYAVKISGVSNYNGSSLGVIRIP